MSLIIPTYEQIQESKIKRAEIFETIMSIRSPHTLHMLSILAKEMLIKESRDHVLSLDEFVELLDLPVLVRLGDLFKNEPAQYTVNSQIQELTKRCLDNYISATEGDE